jgi:Short C-terminal domain
MSDARTEPAGRAGSRAGTIGSYVLVGLAGLLLFLTTFAVWVDRVALETEVFADTSSELIQSEEIRRAIATTAVDEIYDSVDVEEELKGPLPEDVESLAGPTSAGLRHIAPGIVERALEQPRLQRLWRRAVAQTHATFVDVLEERSGTISTEEGVVTLDLGDIVRESADRIGVSEQVESRIDEDAGEFVVLRSDELDTAQDAFRLLNTIAWALPLLTVALFGLAVWVSGGRRRLTLRAIGVAVLVSGAVGLLAVNVSGWYLVGELTTDRESQEAGESAWDIMTELLRGSFRLQIVVGLLVLLAAWIAGPSSRPVAVRRALAPVLRQRRYPYGALAVIAIFLLASGRVDDFARLLGELVVIGLLVAWIEWTRRQTLREFPDVPPAAIVSSAWEWLTSVRERRAATAGAPAEAAEPHDLTARLRELAELHARGELTDEEYAAAKTRVLAGE